MLASGVCKGSSLTGETPSHSVPAAFGRFQVLHQIGAGVLGPVFLARDPDRGRSVAIKVFHLDTTPEQAAELASQLTAIARANLAHPSIVAPFEAAVEGATAYLAEDFVGADSLDAAIRQYGPPPIGQAIRILAAVAGALDFAAAVGIHHGALHPRDLLVTPDDTRVTGFGIGRALESIGMRAPMRRPYVAPERVQREGWDVRADVYSLGVLARELLVGRGRSEAAEPRLPDDQAERLRPVLARATAARPADRFTASLDFIGAVQTAVAGGTSAAAPAPPRASRSRRTHDLLLPLDETTPAVGLDQPPPAAEEDVSAAGAGLGLERPDELPEMLSDVGPVSAAAASQLVDLDLHQEAATAAPRVEGFDLSDLDGGLGGEPEALRHEGANAAAAIGPAPFDRVAESPAVLQDADADFPGLPAPESGGAIEGEAGAAPEAPSAPLDAFSEMFEAGERDARRLPLTLEPLPDGAGEAFEPPLVRERARPGAVPLVAMLVVGLVIGAFAGYLVGVRQRSAPSTSGPAAPEIASSAVPPAPVSSAAPAPVAGGSGLTGSAAGVASPASAPAQGQPAASTVAPPPVAPPSAPAAPVKTSLVVRSTPKGANVLVNGRRRGVTPLQLKDLAPGRYTVRVSRSGFEPGEREVVLSADRPSSTLAFSLDRTASTPPASRAADFYGTLSVESLPSGARVFVDGRLVGTTPLDGARVAAGSHVVRVDRVGFLPWTSPVQVVTGQRHRVTASLEREAK